jgi:hypothetical protein
MKKLSLGLSMCMLLLLTVSLSVPGAVSTWEQRYEAILPYGEPPLPGDMDGPSFDLISDAAVYQQQRLDEPLPTDYVGDIISMIQQVDESLYLSYLEGLVAFGPRVTSEQACFDAGDYIYQEFEELGLETRIQPWEYRNIEGNNIEATLPGTDETSDEIYIICAHYDSVPGSPGADDDGSGIAAVLSAAKVMSTYTFNNTIRFVAFSGEEQGLYGSSFYVNEATTNGDNIVAALNADMIGYTEEVEDGQYIRVYEDEFSKWITDFTTDISDRYNAYIGLQVAPSGYSYGSDHYRFWEYGYNAIFYAEANFNAYYHSPDDTIEHMDIDYAVRSSRLIISTLAELAEPNARYSPEQPQTPEGPHQGTVNTELTYTTSTTDSQGDQVYYLWDWGDGTTSGWLGPYESGDSMEASHSWSKKGTYEIRVKAKDSNDHESEWSQALSVNLPKGKLRSLVINVMLQTPDDRLSLLRELLRLFFER